MSIGLRYCLEVRNVSITKFERANVDCAEANLHSSWTSQENGRPKTTTCGGRCLGRIKPSRPTSAKKMIALALAETHNAAVLRQVARELWVADGIFQLQPKTTWSI